MSRRTKILLVLALVVVLSLILFVPHGGYRREVEAYKKQLIAKGEKLTIEELAPPPPPNNVSNGARAFMQLMANYNPPTNLPSAMRLVAPGLADVVCTNLTVDEMRWHQQNASNVAQIRTALAAPVWGFNLDYYETFELPLPHLTKLRYAERLLVATSAQDFYAKNFADARVDVIAAVDLARTGTNEPFMISGLVRGVMAQDAMNATWEFLQSDQWTDAQWAELGSKWQSIEFFTNSAAVLGFQEACAIVWMAKLREASNVDYIWLANPSFTAPGKPPNGGILANTMQTLDTFYYHFRFSRWKSSWSYEEELHLLQLAEAAQEASRLATSNGAFAPALQTFDQQETNINQLYPDGTNHFLFGMELNYGKHLLTLAKTETARRLTVTAVALKRYHLRHGAYPATLNDLVPDFLSAVPIDFMDCKPLRYKPRTDGDFLLYSVGEDGVDDGGDPRPPPSSPSKNWLYGRDIVWPRVATPAALEEYRKKYGPITNTP
jgi:hypothetical protein